MRAKRKGGTLGNSSAGVESLDRRNGAPRRQALAGLLLILGVASWAFAAIRYRNPRVEGEISLQEGNRADRFRLPEFELVAVRVADGGKQIVSFSRPRPRVPLFGAVTLEGARILPHARVSKTYRPSGRREFGASRVQAALFENQGESRWLGHDVSSGAVLDWSSKTSPRLKIRWLAKGASFLKTHPDPTLGYTDVEFRGESERAFEWQILTPGKAAAVAVRRGKGAFPADLPLKLVRFIPDAEEVAALEPTDEAVAPAALAFRLGAGGAESWVLAGQDRILTAGSHAIRLSLERRTFPLQGIVSFRKAHDQSGMHYLLFTEFDGVTQSHEIASGLRVRRGTVELEVEKFDGLELFLRARAYGTASLFALVGAILLICAIFLKIRIAKARET